MAQFEPVGMSIPVASGTVIRDKRFVTINASAQAVEVSSAGDPKTIGIVRDGSTDGQTRTLRVDLLNKGGVLEVEAGAALSVGDLVTADSQGRAVEATSTGDGFFGLAKTASTAAGQTIEMIVLQGTV